MRIPWLTQLRSRAGVGGSSAVMAAFSIRGASSRPGPQRERQRPFDHEDAIVAPLAHPRRRPLLVGPAPREIALGPVDLVDDRGLRLVGRGREREVGVAAGVVQQRELLVDAALLAVAARVGEAPVAVDERVPETPVGIARQVAVAGEQLQVLAERFSQRLRGVAVVMQMELDLAQPAPRQRRERLEEVGRVLLAGKEEAVARRAAVAVAKALDQRRVSLEPGAHPLDTLLVVHAAPQRLVVIAEREQEVARTAVVLERRARAGHRRSDPPTRVSAGPAVEILVA